MYKKDYNMRNRERSFENRERFNQSVPRESLWYYSEDPIDPSSSYSEEEEKEEATRKYKQLIQERNNQLISKAALRNTFKRKFVVDWEMSDIL